MVPLVRPNSSNSPEFIHPSSTNYYNLHKSNLLKQRNHKRSSLALSYSLNWNQISL